MFKANDKDARTTSLTSVYSDFQQVNISWEARTNFKINRKGLSSIMRSILADFMGLTLILEVPTPQNVQALSNNLSVFANKLFEYVCSFCGVDTKKG